MKKNRAERYGQMKGGVIEIEKIISRRTFSQVVHNAAAHNWLNFFVAKRSAISGRPVIQKYPGIGRAEIDHGGGFQSHVLGYGDVTDS